MLCAPRNDIDLCIFTLACGHQRCRIGFDFSYLWRFHQIDGLGSLFFTFGCSLLSGDFSFSFRVQNSVSKDLLLFFLCHSPLLRPVVSFTSDPCSFTSLLLLNSSHCEQNQEIFHSSFFSYIEDPSLICM